jgi:hypothetical protein
MIDHMDIVNNAPPPAPVEYNDGSQWDERPQEPSVTWDSPNKGLTHSQLIERAKEMGATEEQIREATGR